MFQRTFDRAHQYVSRSVQRDMACETLLERAEANDEVSNDLSGVLALNVHIAAPGNKRGIILHACYDSEEFVGTIGKDRLLRVTRHITPPRCSPYCQRMWVLCSAMATVLSASPQESSKKAKIASALAKIASVLVSKESKC